jgi:rhamnulokinase
VWRAGGADHDYGDLVTLAGEARADVPVFDPDHDSLLHGGDMPARISDLCTAAGQPAPDGAGEMVRSILVSLACKYRLVIEQLEIVTDRRIDTVHVVGGGARNQLLCELTADVCGRGVVTGPVEATALGNVLVQALAVGELSDLADARRVVARSVQAQRHEPRPSSPAAEIYPRFLETTGLGASV